MHQRNGYSSLRIHKKDQENEFSRPHAPSRVSTPIHLLTFSRNAPNTFTITVSSSHKEHRLVSKTAESKRNQENAWNPPATTRLSQPIERASKQRDWGLSKKVYIIGTTTTTTRLAFRIGSIPNRTTAKSHWLSSTGDHTIRTVQKREPSWPLVRWQRWLGSSFHLSVESC